MGRGDKERACMTSTETEGKGGRGSGRTKGARKGWAPHRPSENVLRTKDGVRGGRGGEGRESTAKRGQRRPNKHPASSGKGKKRMHFSSPGMNG